MKKKKDPKSATSTQPDVCFTIMPFGAWFDSYYEDIYVPAIEATGLVPRRADDLYRPSAIVHDIWALTTSAKLLLADLTGKNPNVFYELGLAHAIAKPVILVTESIEDVPFDLRALRVITYDKNEPNWGEVLSEKIEKSIKEVLSSPLEAVLPTFLKIKEEKKPTITQAEKELLSLRQDVDLMRREFQTRIEQVGDFRHERMPLSEVDLQIRKLVAMGMPESDIVMRMRRYGVPTQFIVDRIRRQSTTRAEVQAERAAAAAQKSEGEPSAEKKEEKA